MDVSRIEQLEGRQLLAVVETDLGTLGSSSATRDDLTVSLLEGKDAFGVGFSAATDRVVRFRLTGSNNDLDLNFLSLTDGDFTKSLGNMRVRVVSDVDDDGLDQSELADPVAEFKALTDSLAGNERLVRGLDAGDYYLHLQVVDYGGNVANQENVVLTHDLTASAQEVTAPAVEVMFNGQVVIPNGLIDLGAGDEAVITVKNVGGTRLELGAISFPSGTGFGVVEGLSARLDPGESDTFTIGRTILTPGLIETVVSFTTNDPARAQFNALVRTQFSLPTGTARISGRLFNDTNDNGKRDRNEFGLTGRRIYIDIDDNGIFSEGEPSALSGKKGAYTIRNVAAGTYRVRSVAPGKWRSSLNRPFHPVTVAEGQRVTKKNFAQTQKSAVAAKIFTDKDGDGRQDAGDKFTRGFRLFVDLDNDKKLDKREPQVISNRFGEALLRNLPNGKFTIRVQNRAGFKATTKPVKFKIGVGQIKLKGVFGQRPVKNA